MSLPDNFCTSFLPSQGDGDAPSAQLDPPQHGEAAEVQLGSQDLFLLGSQPLLPTSQLGTAPQGFWGDASQSEIAPDLSSAMAFPTSGFPGPHPSQLLAPSIFPTTGPLMFPFSSLIDMKPIHPSLLKQGEGSLLCRCMR